MKRKIVQIDKEKCNGCGLCVNACHEGAIELIDGKAVLIGDEYCDGLGACLPECPEKAITITEREAAEYNAEMVQKKMRAVAVKKSELPYGCPGSLSAGPERTQNLSANKCSMHKNGVATELRQWPIQLTLINPGAAYLKNADLLIAADCTAYSYGNFHGDFIKGRITMIGCPKQHDHIYYIEKLEEILKNNDIKSVTVVRMEVPCCGVIVHAVKTAMFNSKTIVPYREVVIGTNGEILEE